MTAVKLAKKEDLTAEADARAAADTEFQGELDGHAGRLTGLEELTDTSAPDWFDSRYTYRQKFDVDGSALSADAVDAVVRLDLSANAEVESNAREDRRDVVFTDANDVVLEHVWEDLDPQVLDANAVTTWFTHPEAVYHADAARRLYYGHLAEAGLTTSDGGDVVVESVDIDDGTVQRFVVHAALQRDDHDNPALLFLANGNLVAFYSAHFDTVQRYRICTDPENLDDPGSWEAEETLSWASPHNSFSYSNPYQLDSGRVYTFWRNSNLKPAFTYSDDDCATWAAPQELLGAPGRPYVQYVTDGTKIHLFTTEGHPNDIQTSVFHGYIEGTNLYKSDGTLIGALSAGPYSYTLLTKIYDKGTDGRAWTWDIALDAGDPVVVFATFPGAPLPLTGHEWEGDHHAWYARWTGTAWDAHFVANLGPTINPTVAGVGGAPDSFYSSGMCLDHRDPSRMYLCPSDDGGATYEVERRVTLDGGSSWAEITRLTAGSRDKNFRPTCPVADVAVADLPEVLWLHGTYVGYLGSSGWKCYPPIKGRTPHVARIVVPALSGSTTTEVRCYYGRLGQIPVDPQADALTVPGLRVLAAMNDADPAGAGVRDLAGAAPWITKGGTFPTQVAGSRGKGQQFAHASKMQVGEQNAADPAVYPAGYLGTSGLASFGILMVVKLTGAGQDVSGVLEHVLCGDYDSAPRHAGVDLRVRDDQLSARVGLADGTAGGVSLGGAFTGATLTADASHHVIVLNYTTLGVLSARLDGSALANTFTAVTADKSVVATTNIFGIGYEVQQQHGCAAIIDEFVLMDRPITPDDELLYA